MRRTLRSIKLLRLRKNRVKTISVDIVYVLAYTKKKPFGALELQNVLLWCVKLFINFVRQEKSYRVISTNLKLRHAVSLATDQHTSGT